MEQMIFVLCSLMSLTGLLDADIYTGSRSGRAELIVTTIVIEPYVMRNNGSHVFEGFMIDLLDRLSRDLQFNYRLFPAVDSKFGYKTEDGDWTGMIGELIRKDVDIAAGPMHKTAGREDVVSFTVPFQWVEATMLMKKPSRGGPLGIEKVEDLLTTNDFIQYGTQHRGPIIKALRNSTDPIHKRLLHMMETTVNRGGLTHTNKEGIERVKRDNRYVFIMQDDIADYLVSHSECNLHTIGRFLMKEGLHLALQKDSPLLPYINQTLTKLHTNGFIDEIFNKWWFEKGRCNVDRSEKNLRSVSSRTILPLEQASDFIVLKHTLSIYLYTLVTILLWYMK